MPTEGEAVADRPENGNPDDSDGMSGEVAVGIDDADGPEKGDIEGDGDVMPAGVEKGVDDPDEGTRAGLMLGDSEEVPLDCFVLGDDNGGEPEEVAEGIDDDYPPAGLTEGDNDDGTSAG